MDCTTVVLERMTWVSVCQRTGKIGAATLIIATGAGIALKTGGIATRVAVHGAHHTFGKFGKLPHVQVNWWKPGVKGSGGAARIPFPKVWPDFLVPVESTNGSNFAQE